MFQKLLRGPILVVYDELRQVSWLPVTAQRREPEMPPSLLVQALSWLDAAGSQSSAVTTPLSSCHLPGHGSVLSVYN